MTSLVLRTTVRFLLPLLLMFSMFLLLRGHNEPGGGFVGGLMAAAAFALYSIAYGSTAARAVLSIEPRLLIALGLLTALISGLISAAGGQPFLTAQWSHLTLPGLPKIDIGTPILFDLGVYLAVVGTVLTIAFALEEAG